jgi:type IX secretion system PorP/SprF family membrane protein
MKKLYHIVLIFIMMWLAPNLFGQQEALFSQYIFNLYAINPAYAGARKDLSVNGSYRAQWVGFDGAPTTQNFSVHGPFQNENMALGLQFQNDQIGARKAPFLGLAYAYRLKLDAKGERTIAMALQGGVFNYQYDWNLLEYKDPADPVAFSTDGNFWVPNLDFGLMYLAPKGYFGISTSGLQRSRLNNLAISDARLSTFVNVVGGHMFVFSERFALKPFFMLRHEWNGKAQFDLGTSVLLLNQFWLGAIYRDGFGIVNTAQFVARNGLVIGYAFDWTLNSIRASQSGTHELYIGIDINTSTRTAKTMRYF